MQARNKQYHNLVSDQICAFEVFLNKFLFIFRVTKRGQDPPRNPKERTEHLEHRNIVLKTSIKAAP